MAKHKCLVCGSSMEIGFVPDISDKGRRKNEEWWEGERVSSFWWGVKRPKRTFDIVSWRCTKCGFLMEFSNPAEGGQ
jgi:hypothetical protein